MKYPLFGWVVLAIALQCPGVAASASLLSPCELPGVKRAAQCGVVKVPENPDDPAGRRLSIAVAVIPAQASEPHDDPIVPLMGGPGESAIASAEYFMTQLAPLLRDRDLLLIDQRGTGRSGALRCALYNPVDAAARLRDLFPADAIEACAKQLGLRADLTQYTYTHFARDLEHVRGVLDYSQLNLIAGSYGTRAAQVYLRAYPQGARTVLLHSVVPLDVATPLTMAKTAEGVREQLFDACAADAACAAAFPNLRKEFSDIAQRLDAGVNVAIPGQSGTAPLARGRVAEWFRSMTYRPHSATSLPWMIHEAHGGNWTPIAETISSSMRGIDSELSFGLFFSITCNDDVAFIDEKEIANETRDTFLRDYRVRQQQAACRNWPRVAVPTDRTPVKSSVPTLFVSGDSDAASPLWFTQRVAPGFSERAEVVVHGQGHTEWSDCVARLYERIVRSGSARDLRNASCDAVPRPAFKTQP